ncbi:alpha/beta hydrolase [Caulobacter sp. BK020]|uniref:alpha/beta fold hydrolase n=1 Tax=Caulobacter sp. BK020 TaxID=2512117 RepID=UPI00104A7770|nr:alpha/beta hydrolase [Caulobacter sp. BK020]TCS09949.1 pimeloyl-ACP methyl ester carboxylesterase [Caulobacter sp. BK020]
MTETRPQLLLLPGLLNDAELWRDQISGLADVARCQVADLTQGESLRELAEQVLAGAEPTFALAGFSMGGYVAQEIARIASERIERLALIDTAIRADTPERAAQRRAVNAAASHEGAFLGVADRLMASYVDASRLGDKDLTGRIQAMTQRLGREVFLHQNGLVREDGAAALRALRCPIVIICGEHDAITPLAGQHEMAHAIGCTHMVVIPNAGHMTPMEAPDAVNAALRRWLAR